MFLLKDIPRSLAPLKTCNEVNTLLKLLPAAVQTRTYADHKHGTHRTPCKGDSYAGFLMEDHPEEIHGNDNKRAKIPLKSSLSPCFEKILRSDNFIDKTALILAVLKDNVDPVILCTAPRRFGKSVNLTMLQHFLELEVDTNGKEKTTILEDKDNYKLFTSIHSDLKVMKEKNFVETHFGKYPIIFVDFYCDFEIRSRSEAVMVCRKAIHKAFKKHKYLYKSKDSPLSKKEKNVCERWSEGEDYLEITNEHSVQGGLAVLAEYLNIFHEKQVFMLVDEYDSIISNALYHVKKANEKKELEELESAARFCIQSIGAALKTEAAVFRGAFLTGILDVAGVSLSSALGNISRLNFGTFNRCQDFYGFNEDEVTTLFGKWKVADQLGKKAKKKYNGYINAEIGPLYNPQSIVRFLENLQQGEGALENYWVQSGYIENIYEIFEMDDFRKLLNKLLRDEVKFENEIDITNPFELRDLKSLHNLLTRSNVTVELELVVKFLISLGYLTYRVDGDDKILKIPNDELSDEFNRRLPDYFSTKYGINPKDAEACSDSFSELARLCHHDDAFEEFKTKLVNFQDNIAFLLQTATTIQPLNEASLQTIVSYVCTHKIFFIGDVRIPMHGTKVDLVLYDNKFGTVVEIKCMAESSKDALKQIFTKHYYKVFTMKKHFDNPRISPSLSLLMGMHVDSERKASVLCLRKRDIIDVLDYLKVAEMELEPRIEEALKTDSAINAFLEKAIDTL